MTDWEKRARELFYDIQDSSAYEGGPESILALGREMADERAEEIAATIELHHIRSALTLTDEVAARIARSFISKPKSPPVVDFTESKPWTQPMRLDNEAAIRADEREKIILRLDAYRSMAHRSKQNSLISGITAARSVVAHMDEPFQKTREQVLEEALRQVREFQCDIPEIELRVRMIAAAALEWKP